MKPAVKYESGTPPSVRRRLAASTSFVRWGADTTTLPVRVSFRERFGRLSFEDLVETASLEDGPGGLTPKRLSSR